MLRIVAYWTGRARALPVCVAALALAGCGAGDNDPGPGGVTVGEARALDEAAEMLEEQRLPPDATAATTATPATSSDSEATAQPAER